MRDVSPALPAPVAEFRHASSAASTSPNGGLSLAHARFASSLPTLRGYAAQNSANTASSDVAARRRASRGRALGRAALLPTARPSRQGRNRNRSLSRAFSAEEWCYFFRYFIVISLLFLLSAWDVVFVVGGTFRLLGVTCGHGVRTESSLNVIGPRSLGVT